MIDLLNKVKGINPVVVEQPKVVASILYTRSTVKILKCVLNNPGLTVSEVSVTAKVSRPHCSTVLLRFVRSGILTRESAPTTARDQFLYRTKLTFSEVSEIIKTETARINYKKMGPIEKKILSIVKQMEVCRVHQIADALNSYREYVGVYLAKLIKRGLVISTKLAGTPGCQCVYSINHKAVT